MYCIIFKKKLKKKPPSSGVFRNARWERCYPGSSDYRFAGDEVDRDPMYQYRIALAQTVRKNGRIKRKQWGLATLTYWDLVEDYLDAAKRAWVRQKDVWGVNEGRIFDGIHVHFPHATRAEYDAMVAMIHKKLSRIKTEVISHYKTTEEHQLQLERIKWERRRPADQTAGTSGDPKRTTASQARKTQRVNRIIDSMVSFRRIKNRDLAAQIVTSGYRALCKKFHPDAGGSVDAMQELNQVKKQMLTLLKNDKT